MNPRRLIALKVLPIIFIFLASAVKAQTVNVTVTTTDTLLASEPSTFERVQIMPVSLHRLRKLEIVFVILWDIHEYAIPKQFRKEYKQALRYQIIDAPED